MLSVSFIFDSNAPGFYRVVHVFENATDVIFAIIKKVRVTFWAIVTVIKIITINGINV